MEVRDLEPPVAETSSLRCTPPPLVPRSTAATWVFAKWSWPRSARASSIINEVMWRGRAGGRRREEQAAPSGGVRAQGNRRTWLEELSSLLHQVCAGEIKTGTVEASIDDGEPAVDKRDP